MPNAPQTLRRERKRTLETGQNIALKGAHRLGRLRNRVEVGKGETPHGSKADKAGQRGKQALHLLERAIAGYTGASAQAKDTKMLLNVKIRRTSKGKSKETSALRGERQYVLAHMQLVQRVILCNSLRSREYCES
jgi:hypothetical protein